MRAIDIKIGESYRHKDHPNYCWAKAVEVLKPKQKENINGYIVVKCDYSIVKDEKNSQTLYFKPSDLIKG